MLVAAAHVTKLTSHDIDVVATAMRRVFPMNDTDLELALPLLRARELARGQFFLKAEQMAREGAIVVRGLLREYFALSDGTERTKAFVTEGGPTGSLADLLSQQPSRAFILAEEPTRLVTSAFAEGQALAERSPAWREYNERVVRSVLLIKAKREYELMSLNAAERYAAFKVAYPGLEARVAARHVASYIAVTPVHLSRLRRRERP